jgi:hypothetical protein
MHPKNTILFKTAPIKFNGSQDLYRPFSQLLLAIGVLLLLICFLIVGNGRLSFLKFSD